MSETIRFHEILEMRLRSTMKKFVGKDLNPIVLRAVRNAMFDDVKRVITSSSIKLSEQALGWITNQYFKNTGLNGEEGTINELVIVNDYQLSSFSDHDVTVLDNLFNDTFFGDQLEVERSRRADGKTEPVQ